tara:strand:- start:594 stop:767 length:174 start_codon:yes stop_codon:yes gene_type:complete
MTKLELYTSELLMLKALLENDMEQTSWGDVEYDDVDLMQYYLDRAKVLEKVQEELST